MSELHGLTGSGICMELREAAQAVLDDHDERMRCANTSQGEGQPNRLRVMRDLRNTLAALADTGAEAAREPDAQAYLEPIAISCPFCGDPSEEYWPLLEWYTCNACGKRFGAPSGLFEAHCQATEMQAGWIRHAWESGRADGLRSPGGPAMEQPELNPEGRG